jgi:large subunit ribosomal protein L30
VAKAKKASKKLKITQVRSVSGRMEKHRRTLRALGLRHHQHSVVHEDSATLQGMIRKVSFMLNVQEVEE